MWLPKKTSLAEHKPVRNGGSGGRTTFQIFDVATRSGDIREQIQKMSEIAPKFGRFLACPNFRGRDFQKLYARYEPCIATDRLKSFMRIFPLARKL